MICNVGIHISPAVKHYGFMKFGNFPIIVKEEEHCEIRFEANVLNQFLFISA